MKLSLPLAVILPRKRREDKRFSLNLNIYRNTHYHTLNDAKKVMKDHVHAEAIDRGFSTTSLKPPFVFKYTVYPKTRRLFDLGNVLPIVQKFTDDALIELGYIKDDTYEIIREVSYCFGGIDKVNPRAELEIYEYEEKNDS